MGTRIKLNKNTKKYEIQSQYLDTGFEGDLYSVCRYAVDNNLVKQDEMLLALKIMRENTHSKAEFGMMGCFLYSDD